MSCLDRYDIKVGYILEDEPETVEFPEPYIIEYSK